DDVAVVALLVGAGLELGGVGAGGGLGDAEGLQPELARGDARQILLLLPLAEVPEHRAQGVNLSVAGGGVAALLVDGLENGAAGRDRQPRAAVLLRDQGTQVAGLGQRIDELERVGTLVVELHPVGVGILLADPPHPLADVGKPWIERDGDGVLTVSHAACFLSCVCCCCCPGETGSLAIALSPGRSSHFTSVSGTASSNLGQRVNKAFRAHLPSMRASWWPRKKWMPVPKAR